MGKPTWTRYIPRAQLGSFLAASGVRPMLLLALAAVVAAAQPASVSVQTADGASVALTHHPGSGAPVLLIHGLSANHFTWDLHGQGLAPGLLDAGYDVWLLDLRGRLDSRPPRDQRHSWTLDDYGRYDLAAAIDHVLDHSGHPKVALVGHSMGGMVIAIHHHWHGDNGVGPVVVLGSPLRFDHPDPLVVASTRSMSVAATLPQVPSPAAAWTAALLPQTPHVDALLSDPDGMSRATRKQLYRTIVSPMSSGELGHIRHMVHEGRLVSRDSQVDYLDSLSSWSPPLLVVAGRTDRVAPPDRVVAWLDATGGEDVSWWVAGRARGYPHEYGHLDLVLADTADDWLHRDILEWLALRPW